MTADEKGRSPGGKEDEGHKGPHEEGVSDEGVSEESESMREIYRHDLDRHLWTPPENDESEQVKRRVRSGWRHWLDQLRSFLGMKGG